MFTSCLQKQAQLIQQFRSLPSPEARYEKLIVMGKALPPLNPAFKTPENIVEGCQSILYLYSTFSDGKIFFEISSEALISAGLGALLLAIYNGEPPEALLKCPPTCMDELGIRASLTPGRSNGLASMHLKMQREALKYLVGIQHLS